MQAVMKIKDHNGNTNTNKINYHQTNKDIQINIDNNGQHKQYNLTTDDVGALMDNLNTSNLEQRLLQLGNSARKHSTRKHSTRKHSTRKHSTRKHSTLKRKPKTKKHRKTRKDKGKHHKKHKKHSVRSRTPTPYPKKRL